MGAPIWASLICEPSRWQTGQVLSCVRPLGAALVGRGPVWCSRLDPNRGSGLEDPRLLAELRGHRRGRGRPAGQRPLRPGERGGAAEERCGRDAGPGLRPGEQLVLHGDGGAGVEPEELVRPDDALQGGPKEVRRHGVQDVRSRNDPAALPGHPPGPADHAPHHRLAALGRPAVLRGRDPETRCRSAAISARSQPSRAPSRRRFRRQHPGLAEHVVEEVRPAVRTVRPSPSPANPTWTPIPDMVYQGLRRKRQHHLAAVDGPPRHPPGSPARRPRPASGGRWSRSSAPCGRRLDGRGRRSVCRPPPSRASSPRRPAGGRRSPGPSRRPRRAARSPIGPGPARRTLGCGLGVRSPRSRARSPPPRGRRSRGS